jgi:ABC-type sugar transport system permease subunit
LTRGQITRLVTRQTYRFPCPCIINVELGIAWPILYTVNWGVTHYNFILNSPIKWPCDQMRPIYYFTLSNARRFYSSGGLVLPLSGLYIDRLKFGLTCKLHVKWNKRTDKKLSTICVNKNPPVRGHCTNCRNVNFH